jgi:small basic protein
MADWVFWLCVAALVAFIVAKQGSKTEQAAITVFGVAAAAVIGMRIRA